VERPALVVSSAAAHWVSIRLNKRRAATCCLRAPTHARWAASAFPTLSLSWSEHRRCNCVALRSPSVKARESSVACRIARSAVRSKSVQVVLMASGAFHHPPRVIANPRKMFGKGRNGHRHAPARQPGRLPEARRLRRRPMRRGTSLAGKCSVPYIRP